MVQGFQGENPPEDVHLNREDEARRQLSRLRKKGISGKDAVSQVAEVVELSKNRLYRLWIETGGTRPSTGSR